MTVGELKDLLRNYDESLYVYLYKSQGMWDDLSNVEAEKDGEDVFIGLY